MPGLDASELYVAGNGHIGTAPEDTPMPTADLVDPWIDHGYATEDAVEFTFGKTTDTLKGWQSFDTLRMITTEAPKSVKFTLMQSNVENLLLALGGGTYDELTGEFTPADASQLDVRALFIVAHDGQEDWSFWAPRVLLSDNVVIPWKKTAAAEMPLTFSIQAASSGPAFKFVFPTSWAPGTTNGGGTQAARSNIEAA
jgi:hypothetical protein